MYIDTHTHLYLPEFGETTSEKAEVVRAAIDKDVQRMIFPNVDLTTIAPMTELARMFSDNVYVAMGFHPTEVKEGWRDSVAQIMELLNGSNGYVAVGEVGIDLYWDKTFIGGQMQAFECQVKKAVELDLPVIIHCRDGLAETLEVLEGLSGVRAVFHSFGGTPEDVDRIRRVGDFYFGFNGIVTFKNSKLDNTVCEVTLDRILLETDSPYLTPVPYRGKRNESAFLPFIAGKIAEIFDIDSKAVAAVTANNAEMLFALKN